MAACYSCGLWKVYTDTETFISHEIWMDSSRDGTGIHTHTHAHIQAHADLFLYPSGDSHRRNAVSTVQTEYSVPQPYPHRKQSRFLHFQNILFCLIYKHVYQFMSPR